MCQLFLDISWIFPGDTAPPPRTLVCQIVPLLRSFRRSEEILQKIGNSFSKNSQWIIIVYILSTAPYPKQKRAPHSLEKDGSSVYYSSAFHQRPNLS